MTGRYLPGRREGLLPGEIGAAASQQILVVRVQCSHAMRYAKLAV